MSQGWFSGLGLITLTLLCQSCGQNEGKWKSFPVEIYAESKLFANTEQERDFREAMAFWEAKAGKKLFDYKGEREPVAAATLANIVQFLNPWPFGNDVAGRTTTMVDENGSVRSGIVLMNPDIPFCFADCVGWGEEGTSFRNTITHELGHFIGLSHNTGSTNIMYPVVLKNHSLDEVTVDLDALNAVVGN